jgi:uncharacterized membrane protein
MPTLIAPPEPQAAPQSRPYRAPVRWWAMTVLATLIAAYGLSYLVLRERAMPPNLVESFRARPWGIYPHVLFGAIALLAGPLQFHRGLMMKRRALHRTLGKVYVVSCLVTGGAGLYMAFFAIEGPVTRYGFGGLAVVLLGTTITAYRAIRAGRVAAHREWMIRSFAMILAAVALRIELPLLIVYFRGDFAPAYQIVSFLCWVPNLLWAEVAIRLTRGMPLPAVSH